MLKTTAAARQAKNPTRFQMLLQLAALPVVLYVIVQFFFRVSYTVHDSGIIVITGASTGIGRHAAETLAAKGYHVFAGVRKESDADSINSMKIPTLHPLLVDVTKHDSCVSAIKEIEAFSASSSLPFVALVNNAGISRAQTTEFHDLDDARYVFETNFFGTVDMVQQSLPLLRKSKGRIVMISSVAGFVGAPLYGIYSGTKFAMEGMSDSLRKELTPHGVSVSVVQPGYVKTAIAGKLVLENDENLLTRVGLRPDVSGDDVITTYPAQYNNAQRLKKQKEVQGGSSVDVTTDAITHAITNQYPQTRYAVANAGGMPAQVLAWIVWMLPDRVKDFIVIKLG